MSSSPVQVQLRSFSSWEPYIYTVAEFTFQSYSSPNTDTYATQLYVPSSVSPCRSGSSDCGSSRSASFSLSHAAHSTTPSCASFYSNTYLAGNDIDYFGFCCPRGSLQFGHPFSLILAWLFYTGMRSRLPSIIKPVDVRGKRSAPWTQFPRSWPFTSLWRQVKIQ